MHSNLYPLKFDPILKEKIWGGQKLKSQLNKDSNLLNIGESWELSDVEGDISTVSNGRLKGSSLKQLLKEYKGELIGEKNFEIFKENFPLLIKFIDAKENLSIQLHPNDELAARRHNSFGKTEMWYVMQADDDANLIVGFKDDITPELYLKHLREKSLTEILNFDKVKTGDTYFIEVGRVHAIGAGVMLAEIQQTSDITYRVYDWDRKDEMGNERELHNELAIDAINFNMPDDFRVSYNIDENQSNQMVSCAYFTTNYLDLTHNIEKKNMTNSFLVYMCVEGQCKIVYNDFSEDLIKGETILIPAALGHFEIVTNNAKLLEVYV